MVLGAKTRSRRSGGPHSLASGQKESIYGSAQMPRILTVAELSKYLQIHRTTIYRMIRQGRIPCFRVGSDWRFSLEAIEQWQRENTNPAENVELLERRTGRARRP